jgi:hypothetical protein
MLYAKQIFHITSWTNFSEQDKTQAELSSIDVGVHPHRHDHHNSLNYS